MYRERFHFLYGLLAVVGASAAAAFLGWTAFGQQVRVDTKVLPAPPLTSSATVAAARLRFSGPAEQTVDGQQLGMPAGVTCEVRSLADGVDILCYVKGG